MTRPDPNRPPYNPGQPGQPGQQRPADLPPTFFEPLNLPSDYQPGQVMGGPPEPQRSSGPGCLVWGLMIVVAGLISVLIVVLAGAAGWTEGRRIAQQNIDATQVSFSQTQVPLIATNVADNNSEQLGTRVAFLATRTPGVPGLDTIQLTATQVALNVTATQAGLVNEQLTLIPGAVAAGDSAQVEQRLEFLATQTPGVPELVNLQATATAMMENPPLPPVVETQVQTEAPLVEATPAPVETTAAPTQTAPELDPAALFAQAQDQVNFGQLEEAADTLDLIIRLDPDYQPQAVSGLLNDVLVQRASALYNINLTNDPTNTGTLAEAIRLTNQASNYGSIESLAFELELASLYLDAVGAIEANNHSLAIRRLQAITEYQGTYKGASINQLLFNEYVAFADALFQFDQDYCRAAANYDAALTLFNDAGVVGQRDTAQTLCNSGQQAPAQPVGTLPADYTPIAPIGVPGT